MNIFGYIRGIFPCESPALSIQESMIKRYAEVHGMELKEIYKDTLKRKRTIQDINAASKLGIAEQRYHYVYPELEHLMLDIAGGNADIILVDIRERLYGVNYEHYKKYKEVIVQNHVRVIEVGKTPLLVENSNNVFIYHSTNDSTKRPINLLKQMDEIYEATYSRGWVASCISLDASKNKRPEYKKYKDLLEGIDRENVVAMFYSFRHFSNHINVVIDSLYEWSNKGIDIHTVSDKVDIKVKRADEYLQRHLKVAVYERNGEPLFGDIVRTYCRTKSSWEVYGIYDDVYTMVRQKDYYDVIVVKRVSDISDNTGDFLSLKKTIGHTLVYELYKERMIV